MVHGKYSTSSRITLLTCIAVAACSHGSATKKTAESGASTLYIERVQQTRAAGQSEQFRALMSEHFGFAAWARDATSIGDVTAAREALLNLANHTYDGIVPGAWLPRVRAMQDQARGVAGATRLDQLANGVAQLGRACGECHAATGGGPAVSEPRREPPPTEPDSFPDRMFRHRNAIEQLWLGLIAPSDAVWQEGALQLARSTSELHMQGAVPEDIDQALRELNWLGVQATLAREPFDRAESYGHVLGACAECHSRPWPASF
jgi:hypothetical protein